MFPALLRILGATSSNSSSTSTNIPPSFVTNSEVATQLSVYLSQSSNVFAQILSHFISDNPYTIFLFIVLTVLIITLFLRFVIFLFASKKISKRQIFRRLWHMFLSRNFLWFGLIVGISIGIDTLNMPRSLLIIIKTILLSFLLWLMYGITLKIMSLYVRATLIFGSKVKGHLRILKNKNIILVFFRGLHITWFLVFITILLGLWGVQLGPLLAGLGIAGIVVGLALQDTLSHIIGGVALMLDDTYKEGDFVILEQGQEGIIFQIGYRSTKLRTFDEEIIIIPNGILSKSIITNLSQPLKRSRVVREFQVSAINTTPETIKNTLLQAINSVSGVLKYPQPYIFFLEPKGHTFIFRVNYYVATPIVRLSTHDLVLQEIIKLFKEKNIQFAVDESIIHISEKKHSFFYEDTISDN